MEEERVSTVFDMVMNTIITISKIYGGVLLGSYTLICSGYYTLCDLIEESLAFFASTIRGRKANKRHPFGYGKLENNSGIVIGLIFIILGIYTFISSFRLEFKEPNLYIGFLLILVVIFKMLNADYLLNNGRSDRSEILISSAHSSYYEVIITLISSIFIIKSRQNPENNVSLTILTQNIWLIGWKAKNKRDKILINGFARYFDIM